jgi:DNA-binding YbaB/EbfC family protein
MNQMQQMLMQAQKMQRELAKKHEVLNAKEFSVSKNGIVTVVVYGSKKVKSVTIDKDGFDPENKDMVEEAIVLAINEALDQIASESEAIDESVTGQKGGLPF